MPQYVAKDSIDNRVVSDWARLIRLTADDRGNDIIDVRPFHPFEQTYGEVLVEIKRQTPQGLQFYQMMVRQLPGYDFEREIVR